MAISKPQGCARINSTKVIYVNEALTITSCTIYMLVNNFCSNIIIQKQVPNVMLYRSLEINVYIWFTHLHMEKERIQEQEYALEDNKTYIYKYDEASNIVMNFISEELFVTNIILYQKSHEILI